jgi:kynureninase
VRPDLGREIEPAIAGWAAHARPFEFETGALDFAEAPERFQSGTPNVPALYAARAGYEIIREIGVPAIRAKSLTLTRRLINFARESGFTINSPDDDGHRGGTVIIDVPNGAVVTQHLIDHGIIVDYRPGAGIRIAPHFYTTTEEIDLAVEALVSIAGQPGSAG